MNELDIMNELESKNNKIKEEEFDVDYENEKLSNSINTENFYCKCGEIYATKTGTFSFVCIFCNENYINFELFSKHITSCHDKSDQFSSNNQKEHSNLNEDLFSTVERENNKIIADDCSETIRIENECNKIIDIGVEECNEEGTYNVRIHSGEKPPTYTSQRIEKNMKFHIQTDTGDNRFKCGACHKKLGSSSALIRHKKIHTGEKPKCDQCDKTFASNFVLKIHKRVHSGEKPYKCDQCDKSFARNFDVKIHKRVHTGEKPYKCEHCSKAFSRSWSLKEHILTPTGKKSYKCAICDKKFGDSFGLFRHKKLHTREKTL